jgi:putative hydrolase of the HAD superfamily
MPLAALLIDLDDTLVVEYASADEAFHQACLLASQEHGVHADRLHETARRLARPLWHAAPGRAYAAAIGISSWEALWARFEGEHHPDLETLRAHAPTYRREVWTRTLAAFGIDDPALAEKMSRQFRAVRRRIHDVYPDVRPTLEILASRYRLGLVTNGLACLQRYKLASSGLADYFASVTVAGDVGIAKPDPVIFRHALATLRADTTQSAMVGNSLRSDIAGAQGVGVRAVWVNRLCEPLSDGIIPDIEIESLAELPDTLDAL